MKTCIDCNQQKPIEDFYIHPSMADGRLNKCKPCCKSYQRNRRIENPELARAKDRRRDNQPSRKQWRTNYQLIVRQRSPEKYKARNTVSNALRCGKIVRRNCVECGSTKTQAHHPDYSQPLNVIWVCFQHHQAIHKQTTETR